ncbi:MAG: NAD-dependent epimerase/dehydratase family protein [Candidatus Methylomirabilales bacterium]
MRILVTGSKGFIGRHVVATARRTADEVIEWAADIRDVYKCTEPVDVVLHLAGASRNEQFKDVPHETYTTNVVGTAAVLNYCSRVGARCVLASTSAVYRPRDGTYLVAEDAPIHPTSAYGISKWLAEGLCRQQTGDAGIASTVVRLFNVYGAGQHPSFVIPYVVQCLKEQRPIFLRMPEAIRDFVYVSDVVDALFKGARLKEPGISVFNIGSGRGVRVREMVKVAERVFGEAVAVEEAVVHTDEVPTVVADADRARDKLGWTAVHDLEAGLIAMRNDCRARP